MGIVGNGFVVLARLVALQKRRSIGTVSTGGEAGLFKVGEALRGLPLHLQRIEAELPQGNFHFTNLLVTAIE